MISTEHLALALRDALASDPRVEAVFHNGSHVVGVASPDSDLDFTLLVRAEGQEAPVQQRLAGVFAFQGLVHEVAQYDHKGTRLACTVLPTSALSGMVEGVFHSREELLAYQGTLQHKVVEAVALHDPGGLLALWQARLSQYPDALAEEVVVRATDYLQCEYLEDWGFRSPFHYCYALQDLLHHLGVALYAHNRRFFMPPLKRWPHDLPSLRPNLERELADLIEGRTEESYARPRAALELLVQKLR